MISTNLSIPNTPWPSPMGLQPTPPSSAGGNASVNPILGETNALIGSMQATALQNELAQQAQQAQEAQKKARDLALQQHRATLLDSLPPSQINPNAPSLTSAPPSSASLPFTSGSAVMPTSTQAPAQAMPRSASMPASENPNTVEQIGDWVKSVWTQSQELIANTAQSVAQVVTGAPAQAGTLPPNALATASPLPTMMNSTGGLIHPLAGKGQISSPFGPRGGRNHNGIDLAAPQGTPVVASQGGTVTVNGFDENGYGYWVEIEDPDRKRKTRYGHLVGKSHIAEGTQVAQGQEIGKVGSTGRSTGPHLHYEVRIGGKPQDPMPYLPKGGNQKA